MLGAPREVRRAPIHKARNATLGSCTATLRTVRRRIRASAGRETQARAQDSAHPRVGTEAGAVDRAARDLHLGRGHCDGKVRAHQRVEACPRCRGVAAAAKMQHGGGPRGQEGGAVSPHRRRQLGGEPPLTILRWACAGRNGELEHGTPGESGNGWKARRTRPRGNGLGRAGRGWLGGPVGGGGGRGAGRGTGVGDGGRAAFGAGSTTLVPGGEVRSLGEVSWAVLSRVIGLTPTTAGAGSRWKTPS